jgi:dethiobiotin synthetase
MTPVAEWYHHLEIESIVSRRKPSSSSKPKQRPRPQPTSAQLSIKTPPPIAAASSEEPVAAAEPVSAAETSADLEPVSTPEPEPQPPSIAEVEVLERQLELDPLDEPAPAVPPKELARGLIIFGTESFTGKTAVMSALCAQMKEDGYQARAIKPLCIGSRVAVDAELSFIGRVTENPQAYEVSRTVVPGSISEFQWQCALSACRDASDDFTLIEMPASPATPLVWQEDPQSGWLDGADFAAQLNWPCILLTRYGLKTVEQLVFTSQHLILKGVKILGVVCVTTTPDAAPDLLPENIDMILSERLGVPFLGTVPYSQSISVLDQIQGNLIKLVSSHLDLLPVVEHLDLPIVGND